MNVTELLRRLQAEQDETATGVTELRAATLGSVPCRDLTAFWASDPASSRPILAVVRGPVRPSRVLWGGRVSVTVGGRWSVAGPFGVGRAAGSGVLAWGFSRIDGPSEMPPENAAGFGAVFRCRIGLRFPPVWSATAVVGFVGGIVWASSSSRAVLAGGELSAVASCCASPSSSWSWPSWSWSSFPSPAGVAGSGAASGCCPAPAVGRPSASRWRARPAARPTPKPLLPVCPGRFRCVPGVRGRTAV